ncbi:flagellar biosynthesis protein FliQ [Lachnospiraceae bacterium C1.1]|nr:flagellar biosynthesis protein FliQ [Lachnospiraceae bacterium C1.1]
MQVGTVTDIMQEALYTIITTAAPLLGISLCVGLAVSIFQTVTSIQEQTLTFVPKVISIFLGMMLFGHWMITRMVDYMIKLWTDFSVYIR